jgi:AcrR family transcriptional regulator
VARPSVADHRRRQIIDAATNAIAAHGFETTRLKDVAAIAGVSVGTIQHYFATKDALFAAAFLDANTRSIGQVRATAADATPDPWSRLEAIVRFLSELERWALWFEFWAATTRYPELRAALAAAYASWRAGASEAIADGLASGVFHTRLPADHVAALVCAFGDGLGVQRQLALGWLSADQAADVVLEALSATLGYTSTRSLREAG